MVRPTIDVTCGRCGKTRPVDAAYVRYQIKQGRFTGYCYADRLLDKFRVTRPEHPAVEWHGPLTGKSNGRRETRAWVTCPDCGERRALNRKWVAYRMAADAFDPRCQPCRSKSRPSYIDGARRLSTTGYIRVNQRGIAAQELPLFRAMAGHSKNVPEHRLVMARLLARPLASNELVDHMDGNKRNNDAANLRLYRRGKNDPGSHNGNGTYYHEWQIALARIRDLERR